MRVEPAMRESCGLHHLGNTQFIRALLSQSLSRDLEHASPRLLFVILVVAHLANLRYPVYMMSII